MIFLIFSYDFVNVNILSALNEYDTLKNKSHHRVVKGIYARKC